MFRLFLTFPNESSSDHRLNNELIKSTLTDLTRLSEGFSIVPGHMLVLVWMQSESIYQGCLAVAVLTHSPLTAAT